MAERTDQIWKSQSLAATYLEGVRAAIEGILEPAYQNLVVAARPGAEQV